MNLATEIGTRYSHARRGSRFVGLNAVLSVLGITIGIAALIVVLSVMNGVMTQVRNGVLSFTSHMSIRPLFTQTLPINYSPEEMLKKIPQVVGTAPYIQAQAVIVENERFNPLLLQGVVDIEQHGKVSATFGKLPSSLKSSFKNEPFGIILGEELTTQLQLNVGDLVTVMVMKFNETGAGVFPRSKRFKLLGTFKSGNYNFDMGYSFARAEDVAKLMQYEEGFTGWQIMLKDPLDAPKLRNDIRQHLDNRMFISDWTIDNSSYFNAVQIEKNAMFIILSLIILVALFSLLSTMYMVVTEKRRDIAILRTMGMTKRDILMIFTTQGMIFGLIGTISGMALGIFISLNIPFLLDQLEKFSGVRLDKTMYFVDKLSAQIEPSVVYSVAGLTLGFTLLFSIIPALIAAQTQPARALSQE